MKLTSTHGLAILLLSLAPNPKASGQWMSLADSTAAPVVVESATISAEVTGQFAVTTFDLTFRNPNERALEGTFEFPLLDGQLVTRFALEIDGILREAVPITKERGRVVFEEIQRRRVDPGLLEQTAGNNYRARVFPLPPRGTRRIVIAYQEALARGARDEATYRVTLGFPARLTAFEMTVRMHGGDSRAANVRSPLPFQWTRGEGGRVLAVSERDVLPTGVFELVMPRIRGVTLMTEELDDREYFYAEVALPALPSKPRPVPRVVGVLWDASGSAGERDRAKEFTFLDRWFSSVRDVEVRLVILRDVAERARSHRVVRGNWGSLRRALRDVVHDGASSFDGLEDDLSVDEWLLFSDGLLNFGTSARESRLPVAGVVHTVVASATADLARMRGLAIRHGGEFVNLLATDAGSGAARTRQASARVLGVEYDRARLGEVFPEVGAPVTGSDLAVAGVIHAAEATVRVQVGHTEADARVVEVPVLSGVHASRLAARAWASAKIHALVVDMDRNRDAVRSTSEAFGIVTEDTSLIVLETLEDYVHYDIKPPPELRKAWEAHWRHVAVNRKAAKEAHLEWMVSAFGRRRDWWESGPAGTHRSFQSADTPQARAASAGGRTAGEIRQQGGAASAEGRSRTTSSDPVRTELADDGSGEEVIVLSPFEVRSEHGGSYTAASTMSGRRTRTTLRDVASRREVRSRRERTLRKVVADDAGDVGGSEPLQAWSPYAGYVDRLKELGSSGAYAAYLEERARHVRDVGFYLEVADLFHSWGEEALATRILSNLAELQLESAPLLRILGHRLMQLGRAELAVPVFERVLWIRGEEPQSRRDLALACAAIGQHQRAIDLLWEVVSNPWDVRFPDIGLIALGELNEIAASHGGSVDLTRIDSRLIHPMPVGLRVVLTWDADDCDVDLWIDDPDGERASYLRTRTRQGGLMSQDFTGGYGPEEFILRDPKPGKYVVRIQYYGDGRSNSLGPVTAQVRVIAASGAEPVEERSYTVRLVRERETRRVATFEIAGRREVEVAGQAATRWAKRAR